MLYRRNASCTLDKDLIKGIENMKTRTQFASEPEQHELIENLKTATKKYVSQLDKEGIQTILLNGSIKRGDFCTQHLGGYVDLVVMVKDEKIFNWKKTFGEAEEEFYIYHCVRKEIDGLKVGFQIEKRPFETLDYFETLDENRRWAHLESEILYDEDDLFVKELEKINALKRKNLCHYFKGTLNYIESLISNYKKQKFYGRDCPQQLHENLNVAIKNAIKCLYYINGQYMAPEDRALYYSFDLEKLPSKYEKIMEDLYRQEIDSYKDYKRREFIFKKQILDFIYKNNFVM